MEPSCCGGGGDIHKNKYNIKYDDFIDKGKLFSALKSFVKGKTNREDINEFAVGLGCNILNIQKELFNRNYKHDKYFEFVKIDIKKRLIHKATVKDRLVHFLIYKNLYDYFDKYFLYDSYSCRKNKGVHKAIERYEFFARKISKNYTRQVWILKFDIKKCFASVDQEILLCILKDKIKDIDVYNLVKIIVKSFDKGLPLGNITSQLFINVYLHELDFYCKQKLKIKYYIRYADDVICMFENKDDAFLLIKEIEEFTKNKLKLQIHKIKIKTLYSGIDFLGWVHFPKFRLLRKVTKRKMLNNYCEKNMDSYDGLMRLGNTYKIKMVLKSDIIKDI